MDPKRVISLRFNQDQGCFTCCTEAGCTIYRVDPLDEQFDLDFQAHGSFVICEMLHQTQLCALVPGGRSKKYEDNIVLIFDYCKEVIVSRDTVCASTVIAVRMRKDRVFAATSSQIRIFKFEFPQTTLIWSVSTIPNPKGIIEVAPSISGKNYILVCPGQTSGSIQLLDCNNTDNSSPLVISAHYNDIACIATNQQGTLLATASVKGSIIRVWDIATLKLVVELRTGNTFGSADIYSINFNKESEYLCCATNRGNVHIFALKNKDLNVRSMFSMLSMLSSYASSHWAMATFQIPQESACICAFNELKKSVTAICKDGTYNKFSFNNEGDCSREEYRKYLDVFPYNEFYPFP